MLRMNFDASTAASVTDVSKSVFSIYPNPSNGLIYIDLDVTKEYDVFVYNALGQLVLETAINNNANIDLSIFDKGIYTVKLVNDSETYSQKFVIE